MWTELIPIHALGMRMSFPGIYLGKKAENREVYPWCLSRKYMGSLNEWLNKPTNKQIQSRNKQIKPEQYPHVIP